MALFHPERFSGLEKKARPILPQVRLKRTYCLDDNVDEIEGHLIHNHQAGIVVRAREELPFYDDNRRPDELAMVNSIWAWRTFETTPFRGASVAADYQGDGYLKEYQVGFTRKGHDQTWVEFSIDVSREGINAKSPQGQNANITEGTNYVVRDQKGQKSFHFKTQLTPDHALVVVHLPSFSKSVQFRFPRNIGPTQPYIHGVLDDRWKNHLELIQRTVPKYLVQQ